LDDSEIVKLYWERSEDAINATDIKYGRLCRHIAGNLLNNKQDEEECVNDAYLAIWNTIPPGKPCVFSAFLGRIVINQALKKIRFNTAKKRSTESICSLSELGEIVSGKDSVENEIESNFIESAINSFLWSQSEEKRLIFINRYWYNESIDTISKRTGFTISKVTSMLYQTRHKLKAYLESEGIEL
jgi:RNA polymerase sigma-70 factor (ECF subfamily)